MHVRAGEWPTGVVAMAVVLAAMLATFGTPVAGGAAPAMRPPPAVPTVAPPARSADPRAGAIGLLALPEVFGTEPCQRFRARPVAVYARPGSDAGAAPGAPTAPLLGAIRTTVPWRIPPEGGCEGLRVDYVAVDGAAAELPVQEYAAEQPAAIVLEARDGWFRVRLPAGEGWVQATAQDEYAPLLALLERDTLVFTGEPELRAAPAPDAVLVFAGETGCRAPRIRALAGEGDGRWLDVELVPDECCAPESIESTLVGIAPSSPDAADAAPAVAVRGWVPLRRADGVPTLWFAARGC